MYLVAWKPLAQSVALFGAVNSFWFFYLNRSDTGGMDVV